MAEVMTGRCLCGVIRFEGTPKAREMDACHCRMCRRWSAGPFLAVEMEGGLRIDGEDQLGVYASSDWGERCFCRRCGSVLFWRLRDGSHTAVSAGALDTPDALVFSKEIFVDEKPAHYAFAGDRPRQTGAEAMAGFADGTA